MQVRSIDRRFMVWEFVRGSAFFGSVGEEVGRVLLLHDTCPTRYHR